MIAAGANKLNRNESIRGKTQLYPNQKLICQMRRVTVVWRASAGCGARAGCRECASGPWRGGHTRCELKWRWASRTRSSRRWRTARWVRCLAARPSRRSALGQGHRRESKRKAMSNMGPILGLGDFGIWTTSHNYQYTCFFVWVLIAL